MFQTTNHYRAPVKRVPNRNYIYMYRYNLKIKYYSILVYADKVFKVWKNKNMANIKLVKDPFYFF